MHSLRGLVQRHVPNLAVSQEAKKQTHASTNRPFMSLSRFRGPGDRDSAFLLTRRARGETHTKTNLFFHQTRLYGVSLSQKLEDFERVRARELNKHAQSRQASREGDPAETLIKVSHARSAIAEL